MRYYIMADEGWAGWHGVAFPGAEITRREFYDTWRWLYEERKAVSTPTPPPGEWTKEIRYVDDYGFRLWGMMWKERDRKRTRREGKAKHEEGPKEEPTEGPKKDVPRWYMEEFEIYYPAEEGKEEKA